MFVSKQVKVVNLILIGCNIYLRRINAENDPKKLNPE